MTSREQIDQFLNEARIAIVGVSRDPQDFSRALLREFVQRGYDVVPVNPQAVEIDGLPCFAGVQAIDPPVGGVLVMTPPHASDGVMQDCVAAGVKRVWLHQGVGQGSVSADAVARAKAHHIDVIAGYCPFMFLPRTHFLHRLHGVGLKLQGRYPA